MREAIPVYKGKDYFQLKDELNTLVQKLIHEHTGGEQFFDALDEAIREGVDCIGHILSTLNSLHFRDTVNIIVSGKFGEAVKEHALSQIARFNIIHVNGGLREGKLITPLKGFDATKPTYFIDDSFYSGKTRDAVQVEVERLRGTLQATLVVYDGSQRVDMSVISMYHYYSDYMNQTKEVSIEQGI